MPTASLADLVNEIADVLRDAIGAGTTLDVQVEPTRVLNPTPPSIDIYPADPFAFRDASGFGDVSSGLLFTVRARIDTGDQDASQGFLLALLDDESPLSVAVALEDDQTLNGLASSVDEIEDLRSGYRIYEDVAGQGAFLGCEWTFRVLRATS